MKRPGRPRQFDSSRKKLLGSFLVCREVTVVVTIVHGCSETPAPWLAYPGSWHRGYTRHTTFHILWCNRGWPWVHRCWTHWAFQSAALPIESQRAIISLARRLARTRSYRRALCDYAIGRPIAFGPLSRRQGGTKIQMAAKKCEKILPQWIYSPW